MARTIPGALQTHLDTRRTSLAFCLKITRVDGTELGFTDHDLPLTLDADGAGAIEYSPSITFNRTSQTESDQMQVNGLDLECAIDGSIFTEQDLAGGLYDGAAALMFYVNWASTGDGIVKLQRGTIGVVDRADFGFKAEFRSLAQNLQTAIGAQYAPGCRSPFGDQGAGPMRGCRFKLDPPAWEPGTDYGETDQVIPTVPNDYQYKVQVAGTSDGSSPANEPTWPTTPGDTVTDGTVTWVCMRRARRAGVVSAVTSRKQFTVGDIAGDLAANTGGTKSGGYFAAGRVIFTTGANEGLSQEIVAFTDPTGSPPVYQVTTFLPFPFDLSPLDEVTLEVGCDHTFAVCRDNFLNWKNYRGEPYVPGEDVVFQIKRAPNGGSGK
ncbi:MAG: DUF2163 domain-containing protein [Alphaproteobacteria bacterium]|nr:DUF2163 domain-containing protein [Alphaproteobacteria bacterium]